jgi:hypothetical protein
MNAYVLNIENEQEPTKQQAGMTQAATLAETAAAAAASKQRATACPQRMQRHSSETLPDCSRLSFAMVSASQRSGQNL